MDLLMGHINHWHWWIFAVILLVMEVLTPGTFFLWMGVSAAVVGLLTLLLPIQWEMQVIFFAILSIVSIVVGRHYFKRRPITSDRPNLNRRGHQYVGRTFTLKEPIINGYGKIRVDDTSWKVEGVDTPAGRDIRVVGVDGVVLKVESVETTH